MLDSGRFYRHRVKAKGLVSFEVTVEETDLHISASKHLKDEAEKVVSRYRQDIKDFIKRNPAFVTTFEPFSVLSSVPPIIRSMSEAARQAGVGPMAAVAGAIAEYVGKDLLKSSAEVIVENGGDIFIKILEPRKMGIYAGRSALSEKVALTIYPDQTPLGVCTSSGTVGHSVSFGRADAVVILSKDTSLADAVATSVGNRVKTAQDIEDALAFAQTIPGVDGAVVIVGDKIGMWGEVEITE